MATVAAEQCGSCGNAFLPKRQWWSPEVPWAMMQEGEYTPPESPNELGQHWYEFRECGTCRARELLDGTPLVDGPGIPLAWSGHRSEPVGQPESWWRRWLRRARGVLR